MPEIKAMDYVRSESLRTTGLVLMVSEEKALIVNESGTTARVPVSDLTVVPIPEDTEVIVINL